MRSRWVRITVGLAVLGLIAAACSKPTKTKGVAQANNGAAGATVPGVSGPTTTGAAATTPGGGSVIAAKGAGRPGVAPGAQSIGALNTGDLSQAEAVGSQIYPQSTTRGPKPYYQGVGDNTITVDYGYDATTCGVNTTAALVAAGGTVPAPNQFYRGTPTTASDTEAQKVESEHVLLRFFNEHGFDLAAPSPNVRKYMGNDPNNQYFGRHLVENIIDSGSYQCPDKTKAAAVRADQQDHAFAVLIDDSLEGSAYNMAADLNAISAAHRPMQFGTLWLSDQIYNRFAPFDWTQFATGSTIVNQEASWVCSRLVGHAASNSPDPILSKTTRKFGFVHSDLPQVGILASEYKADLQRYCGKNIIVRDITYNGSDVGAQQTDATNIAVQLKSAQVTSVLMLTDLLFPDFLLLQAQNQSYRPEWVWSSFGLEDASPVQRAYDSANCSGGKVPGSTGTSPPNANCETRGSIGLSQLGVFGGFNYDRADAFNAYHLYHQTAPDGKPCDPSSEAGMDHGQGENGSIANYCKAPTAMMTQYYVWLDFIGGLLFSGPTLTPTNITNGLQHYPHTRYGGNGPSSDPRPALVGPGPGKYGFVTDGVEWKWRPDFVSPTPEGLYGWVSYPDCQRHYLLWPNQYSPGWEPGGAAYSSYCNDARGYPTHYRPQP